MRIFKKHYIQDVLNNIFWEDNQILRRVEHELLHEVVVKNKYRIDKHLFPLNFYENPRW